MEWFSNLPTRTKLFLSFGLMTVVFMASTGTTFLAIQVIQRSHGFYRKEVTDVTELWTLRSKINGVRATLLTMMLDTKRVDQKKWEQDIKERTGQIEELMQSLSSRHRDDPETLRRLDKLNATIKGFQQTQQTQIIPFIHAGKIDAARALMFGIQTARHEEIRATATKLGEDAQKAAGAAVDRSEARANQSMLILGSVGGGYDSVEPGHGAVLKPPHCQSA